MINNHPTTNIKYQWGLKISHESLIQHEEDMTLLIEYMDVPLGRIWSNWISYTDMGTGGVTGPHGNVYPS